jgi:hypothetical protein
MLTETAFATRRLEPGVDLFGANSGTKRAREGNLMKMGSISGLSVFPLDEPQLNFI